jgi:hypothetical protein
MRRPVDAQMPEVVETNGNGAAAPIERRIKIHPQAREAGSLDAARGSCGQSGQALLSGRQLAGQELAFRPIYLQ